VGIKGGGQNVRRPVAVDMWSCKASMLLVATGVDSVIVAVRRSVVAAV